MERSKAQENVIKLTAGSLFTPTMLVAHVVHDISNFCQEAESNVIPQSSVPGAKQVLPSTSLLLHLILL